MNLLNKCAKGVAATVAAVTLMIGSTGSQAGIIGVVEGPDSSFSIEVDFLNSVLVSPFSNVLSLSLNGGTALAGNIVWDSYSSLCGSDSSPTRVV